MVKHIKLKLSWLFVFLFLGYFPIFGMYFPQAPLETEINEFNDLSEEIRNLIQNHEEFIYLDFQNQDAFKRPATGVYKLIPYYQRIFPQDSETSRFIIQKQAFNGEWQLTEIYDHIYRKTIHSFSKEKQNPVRDHIIAQILVTLQNQLKEKDKIISNFEEELKSKNEIVESSIKDNSSLNISSIEENSSLTIYLTDAMSTDTESVHKNSHKSENQIIKDLEMKLEKIQKSNEKLKTQLKHAHLEKKEECEKKLLEKDIEIKNIKISFQNKYNKLKLEHKKTFTEKQRLIENQHALEKEKLKNTQWDKIENLKEELKLFEKENEIKNLQDQLLKSQQSNEELNSKSNNLNLVNEFLENEVKNLRNFQKNLETKLSEEKKKFKEFTSEIATVEEEKKLKNKQWKEFEEKMHKDIKAEKEKEASGKKKTASCIQKINGVLGNTLLQEMGLVREAYVVKPSSYNSKSIQSYLKELKDVKIIDTHKPQNTQLAVEPVDLNWKTKFYHLKSYIHSEHIEHIKFFDNAFEKYKNEDKKGRINSIIETENILTDPEFSYENALVNYAHWFYADEQHKYFQLHNEIKTVALQHYDNNFLLESTDVDQEEAIMDNVWKENHRGLINVFENVKNQFKNATEDTLRSIKDPKKRLLCQLFIKNSKLLVENKYQYEMLVVQYGFILYGKLQKKIIQDVEYWWNC